MPVFSICRRYKVRGEYKTNSFTLRIKKRLFYFLRKYNSNNNKKIKQIGIIILLPYYQSEKLIAIESKHTQIS